MDWHHKTYGIVPDTQSKEFLKKTLKKMKQTNEKFRKSSSNREIKKIEFELKEGPRETGNEDMDNLIKVKLMSNAN